MRPIDANALLEKIEEEIEAEKSYDNYDKGVTAGCWNSWYTAIIALLMLVLMTEIIR